MTTTQIWWQHARPALPLCLCAAVAFAITDADLWVAQRLFFDESVQQWRGAGQWWATNLLHGGGGWLIRVIAIAAIIFIALSYWSGRWCDGRRPVLYFIAAMSLTIGTVGLLKATTNVDCPWDLQPFNGLNPYIRLFADRPDTLPVAKCFPAAHASSGYALMALYFVFFERSKKWALQGLATGLIVGTIFGLGQQARGAHFVSHDIVSCGIAWFSSLTLYVWGFQARLWSISER